MDAIGNLLKMTAADLPGFVSAAVVHLEDGLSIQELNNDQKVEAGEAAAYLATIVQSNLKALKVLAGGQVTDDILITTNQYYFLIRHPNGQPFFLFIMLEKDEWLGRARLLMKELERRIVVEMDRI